MQTESSKKPVFSRAAVYGQNDAAADDGLKLLCRIREYPLLLFLSVLFCNSPCRLHTAACCINAEVKSGR